LVATATAVALLAVLVLLVPRLTAAVASGFGDLRGADPRLLAIAGVGFLCSGLASAAAWHRGLFVCGARLARWEVIRRYAAGSFANALAPAQAGEAVRVALLSRAMRSDGAVFTTMGVAAAVSIARVAVVALLFTLTLGFDRSLLWLALLLLIVAIVAVAVRVIGPQLGWRRARHALDVVRGLKADPRAAAELFGWLVLGTAGKVFAAACAAQALGVPHPVAAAFVIVPTLELVGFLPLTPGNIGLTSAAVALTLRGHGVPAAQAVGVGIAVHAVETLVGVVFGGACALSLATWTPGRTRRVVGAAGLAVLIGAAASIALGLAAELR